MKGIEPALLLIPLSALAGCSLYTNFEERVPYEPDTWTDGDADADADGDGDADADFDSDSDFHMSPCDFGLAMVESVDAERDQPVKLAFGHLDRDDLLDAAIATNNSQKLSIGVDLYNSHEIDPGYALHYSKTIDLVGAEGIVSAAIGDVNGDGRPEVVTFANFPSGAPSRSMISYFNADGTPTPLGDTGLGGITRDGLLAEVDGTDPIDIVAVGQAPDDSPEREGVIMVWQGVSDGSPAALTPVAISCRDSSHGQPARVASADFTGDGIQNEIAVIVHCLDWSELQLFQWNGARIDMVDSILVPCQAVDLSPLHRLGLSRADTIAVVCDDHNWVQLFDVSVEPLLSDSPRPIATGEHTFRAFAAGDFDGDGDDDVVAHYGRGTALMCNDDGFYVGATSLAPMGSSEQVVIGVANLDGTGPPEIVVAQDGVHSYQVVEVDH